MNFVGASLLAILQSVQSKSIASKLAPTGVVVWRGFSGGLIPRSAH